MISGKANPPAEMPAMAMPSARPRRLANQRESSTVTATGPISTLAGAISSAKAIRTCTNDVASEIAV